ncbi:MAG: hypothetical protein JXB10_07770 [Pirellulales bacterium]|nr:hypothetical protein [Pirellulales bacterium]
MLYNQGKGHYDQEYAKLWKELVPVSGQAKTIQGELVRVIGRLADEFYRNGNTNWDVGYRIFTNFLSKHLLEDKLFNAQTLDQIKQDIAEIRDFGSGKKNLEYIEGEDAFDRITDRVVEWCQHNSVPIEHTHNPKLYR